MPERFDLGDIDITHVGKRLLHQPCRDANAQPAGDEFEEGKPA